MTAAEFLETKLVEVDKQLSSAILNRGKWTALCENRHILVFLTGRCHAPDFSTVEGELQRIAQGQLRVPGLTEPRRKATDCLRDWSGHFPVPN